MNYTEFPPYKYFLRVLKNYPKSALLYVELWKKKGKSQKIDIIKKDIRKDFFISPTLYRNLLMGLTSLNLIEVEEDDQKYAIEMLGASTNNY